MRIKLQSGEIAKRGVEALLASGGSVYVFAGDIGRNIVKSLPIVILFLLVGEHSIAQWIKLTPVNPVGNGRPTKFVIGDTIYYGCGDPYNSNFYQYTTQSNTWVQVANCPNGGGDQGFQFVINDTAYIGDGANPGYHNDFWSYTPASGWYNVSGNHPSAIPPGGGLCFTAGFSIGNKGYFGSGYTNGGSPDVGFYEYDPSTFTWTTKAPLPLGTFGPVAFSANGKGYMGLGYVSNNGNNNVFNTMYQYDPVLDQWNTMAPLPASVGMGEAEPAFFVLCGKLIVTLGQTVHSASKATHQAWMFDPTDGPIGKWFQLPDCPAYPSYSPGGFALRDTGYVVGGTDTFGQAGILQMYRYIPNINPLTVTPNITTCLGTSVTITADGGGAFKWSPAVGLSDSITTSTQATGGLTTVSANPSVTTTYTVTEAVCGQTATVVVTVGTPQPDTAKASPPSICGGQSSTLTVTGNSTYTWFPSAGLNATTGNTVMATPDSTTTYIVTSGGGGSCSTSDTVIVTVGNILAPGELSTPRDTLCQGTPGNMAIAGNGSNIIQWQSSSDGNNFNNISGVIDTTKYKTFPLLGTTWYRAVVGTGSCSAITDTLQLYVPPALTAYFGYTQTADNQLSFNCDSSSGNIRSYHWDFGDGQTSIEKNPRHTYAKDTTYYVCLTLYDGSNCSYTFCRYSTVTNGVGVPYISATGKWTIYPNPFSNQFSINGNELNKTISSIELYDVLGRLVFNKDYETQNKAILVNLTDLSQGMYFLEIKTTGANFFQPIIKQR